eukprot:TRINITY_DN882_c0_g1_i1.p1 TRINITY_DN882_c0_g1~~TRINITY_DN882_c0_g1_i1.p1  ORF type:complete len:481 (-),score=127.84 TRINITY_DN882_c0_g1_i1:156-1577(-)
MNFVVVFILICVYFVFSIEVIDLTGEDIDTLNFLKDEDEFTVMLIRNDTQQDNSLMIGGIERFSEISYPIISTAIAFPDQEFLDPKDEFKEDKISIAKYSDCEAPAVLMFNYGRKDLHKPMQLDSDAVEVLMQESFITFTKTIQNLMPHLVSILTDNTFDQYLKGAPEKKNLLLFSNQPTVPTMFRKLSLKYFRWMRFAFITRKNAISMISRYRLEDFPALYLVDSIPERGVPQIRNWNEYEGSINYSDISRFVESHIELVGGPLSSYSMGHIETKEQWEGFCGNYTGVCFVGLMNPELHVTEVEELRSFSERAFLHARFENASADKANINAYSVRIALVDSRFVRSIDKLLKLSSIPTLLAINPERGFVVEYDEAFKANEMYRFALDLIDAKETGYQFKRLREGMEQLAKVFPTADEFTALSLHFEKTKQEKEEYNSRFKAKEETETIDENQLSIEDSEDFAAIETMMEEQI